MDSTKAEMGEPDAAEEDLLPGTPARQMILEEPKAQEEPHKKGTKAKKKKKKQYVPLPTLEAREDELSFSISFTQRLGRHAVARRKIEAGDLILRELPVGSVVKPEARSSICHVCFRRLGSSQVDAGYYKYCSDQCAAANKAREVASKVHTMIPAIAREAEVDQLLLHFMLELDVQRTLTADGRPTNGHATATADPMAKTGEREEPLIHCSKADVDVLLSHWDQQSERWRQVVSNACRQLHAAVLESGAYQPSPVHKLQELAAIINGNSHGCGVANDENIDLALGLFPALSMFNHSCLPNTCFAAPGQEMQVRALRSIEKGQQLTVSYINLMEDRATRRDLLATSKHFTCACERCAEPLETGTDRFLEGLACSTGGCPGPMVASGITAREDLTSDQEWKCCTCGKTETDKGPQGRKHLLMALKTHWQQAILMLKARGHQQAQPQFETLLSKSPGTLHPLHALQIDCLMPLVNCCRARQDHQAALQHLTRLIQAMDKVLGIATPELGNLLGLSSQLLEERALKVPAAKALIRKQAREAAARALHIKTLTLGPSSPAVEAAAARLRRLKA